MAIINYGYQSYKLPFLRLKERQRYSFFFSLNTGINCYHLSDFAYGWTNGQAAIYIGKMQPKYGKQFFKTYLLNFSTNITHVLFPRNYHSNFLLQIYHYSFKKHTELRMLFCKKKKIIIKYQMWMITRVVKRFIFSNGLHLPKNHH